KAAQTSTGKTPPRTVEGDQKGKGARSGQEKTRRSGSCVSAWGLSGLVGRSVVAAFLAGFRPGRLVGRAATFRGDLGWACPVPEARADSDDWPWCSPVVCWQESGARGVPGAGKKKPAEAGYLRGYYSAVVAALSTLASLA